MLQVHDSHWGNPPTAGFAEALTMAGGPMLWSCAGAVPHIGGRRCSKSDGGGDRVRLGLPGEDARAISQTGKPIILVLLNGSLLAVNCPMKTWRRLSSLVSRKRGALPLLM